MRRRRPRILIVTPEITYLPEGMGNLSNRLTAKAGGLADVSASLVASLHDLGADVHVALPHYRQLFHIDIGRFISDELRTYLSKLPEDQVHLAEDRIFYYRDAVYSGYETENLKLALVFQREVINNIMPRVRPDLVHCNDWMTGLVPAHARRLGIPSLFTVHNIHSRETTLARVEDLGIDAAEFWQNLYYVSLPGPYEQTREAVPIDLLTSGIFAAHFINTVSPSFLREIVEGRHDFVPAPVRDEIRNKHDAGCAAGILNAPDPSYHPVRDDALVARYGPERHAEAKRENKLAFQRTLGLETDPEAPLFFWPSRLDPVQKGCDLLAHILYETVSAHWAEGLQVAFVANGPAAEVFAEIVRFHGIGQRVAVHPFREDLSRLGYAAADFVLMPSRFEPCGLPQMIGMLYGALPVVHDTGGLHDTVEPLDPHAGRGNGFRFEVYDPPGLRWAIEQAVAFHRLPPGVRAREIRRIMAEAAGRFTHAETARRYIELYERMLARPLVG
ncbi:glycogen synthase [Deferrisoma camini]|uniref:glycogen synthase n=1 Tax=Deferrisoma camini TaxID=1035120 RepID=UPI0004BCDCB9|nr:glycogen/starch synthase [Deferrisoma camini]